MLREVARVDDLKHRHHRFSKLRWILVIHYDCFEVADLALFPPQKLILVGWISLVVVFYKSQNGLAQLM